MSLDGGDEGGGDEVVIYRPFRGGLGAPASGDRVAIPSTRQRPEGPGEGFVGSGQGSGIVNKPSNRSVEQTVGNVRSLLLAKGVTLFAVIDHSGEAERVAVVETLATLGRGNSLPCPTERLGRPAGGVSVSGWGSGRPRKRPGPVPGSLTGSYPAGSLRNESNLAVGAGLENLLVSAGGLGKRQLLPDDGPEGVVP
jgi:hypothetical protein